MAEMSSANLDPHKLNRVRRAKRYLVGAALAREDSDDELGIEDHPWEWIYEESNPQTLKDGSVEIQFSASDHEDTETLEVSQRKRGRSRRSNQHVEQKIVGARMGTFTCHVGDCVLLKADGTNEAWVGIICEFMEEDEMMANFMWFSTHKEISNKHKKRTDTLSNELYITPSWDHNPLASINGKATILSEKSFMSKYPTGKIPRKSTEYGKVFICRRGCNTRTATYTEEFVWEDIYNGTDGDIYNLIERVQNETKATRKPRNGKTSKEGDKFELRLGSVDDDLDAPITPRKRQKISTISTPQKIRTPSKLLTPSHKRVVVKKPLEFTPLGTRVLPSDHVFSSPFQTARASLHVSSVPTSLPCREDEFASVYSHLEAAISDGTGTCIYISGTPGTGKTATVREVVAQLNASVLADELDDFLFVEINGMKVTDPHQSYSLLWEALKGDRVSPSHALDLLEREFNHPSPRRVPCVVLMDELDQLVTRNQSVMYNFFNWPGLRHSRLIVLAVANTMDLPERTLSNKISIRLGLTRITFPGYTHDQLMKIIQSRLEGVSGSVVEPDAIQFASRKVAAVSGDARRALDICRRAVEIAESESLTNASAPNTPSKKKEDATSRPPIKSIGKVTIATVKRAINEATTSPLQQHLRGLPLAAKVFLASLIAKTRRTGIAESILGEVIDEAKRMIKTSTIASTTGFLLEDLSVIQNKGVQSPAKKAANAPRILSMGLSAMDLMEAGIVGLEARKVDRTGKIRLIIGEEDVKLAFKDDPDIKGIGFSI